MLTKIPRPRLGDKMFRNTLIGLREEAMVVSITASVHSQSDWTAVMMTKNGVEFIGSDREHRGQFDWAPLSWEYDEIPDLRKEDTATEILSAAWKGEAEQEALSAK